MTQAPQLVVWSWLNQAPFSNRRALTRGWIRQRFDLWKRTALRSISRQTARDFRYCLICSPKARGITAPLADEIEDDRVSLVHAGDELAAWRRRLPELGRYVEVRLDSDDRYHPRALEFFRRASKHATTSRPFLQANVGFAVHDATGTLFEWRQGSSPFYARVWGPEFRTGAVADPPSHREVAARAGSQLRDGLFVVTLHGLNTSTAMRSSPLGPRLPDPFAAQVRRAFGLPAPTPRKGAIPRWILKRRRRRPGAQPRLP